MSTLFDTFAALHVPGKPLILWNIWDAGSAAAVAGAGAPALATGSLGLAGALGYPDGEAVPLALLLTLAGRIAAAHDLPLSVDFETGYDGQGDLAGNAADLAATGAVGCNIEDRLLTGGIRPVGEQAARLRHFAAAGLFVNARTDLFLGTAPETHEARLPEALERAGAYADAGARSFFAPGLTDPALIGRLCEGSPLPVNILRSPAAPDVAALARLGVARVSFGPFPWRRAMASLADAYRADIAG